MSYAGRPPTGDNPKELEQKLKAEYDEKIDEYRKQRRFTCHYEGCQVASREPARVFNSEGVQIYWWWVEEPGDLKRCARCFDWFCNQHYSKSLGMCLSCAKKRPGA